MCTSGIPTAEATTSATLCMVLVQSTNSWLPAASHTRFARKSLARLRPRVQTLQLFDLGEVNRPQHAVRGVQATGSLARRVVNQPVVLG
jgi:hypothetical protein